MFFALERFIFLAIFRTKLYEISFAEKTATFYHGLRLDLSMAGYITIAPLLIYILSQFIKQNQLNFKWLKIYNIVLITLFSFVATVNFNVYSEWGSKINEQIIAYAIHSPKEAMASSASSPFGLSALVFVILISFGYYLNFILVRQYLKLPIQSKGLKIAFNVLALGVNFLFIRGGTGTAPNSQSMAYFSNYPILNIASLNTEWNLVSSILSSGQIKKNPYPYLDNQTAQDLVNELYTTKKDSTVNFLKTNRPNVVIFILESFTADLTKALGNEDGITPNLDSLAKIGILFSQIYSAGNRTDKGLIGTLAGYPTLGSGSIVKWPEKMQQIPALSQVLYKNGYNTSFYYGGESEFDNYKAFVLGHDFKHITDKKSFDSKDMNSKWGAYDGVVFNKQLSDSRTFKSPFLSAILSLTNHEPFELPSQYKFGQADNIQKFKSTAFYTDSCIGNYLSEAKKQDWYKNTLFVFIADHGHPLPKNDHEIYDPKRFHVPLIFYGEVIRDEFKGKTYDKTGSQTDVVATLLAQLKLNHKDFIWSKDLMNPYRKNFAYFSWDNAFGFIKDGQALSFDNVGKKILYNSNTDKTKTDSLLNYGKAYIQSVYNQFIKL
jgi:phosphoglycerol transferase MdoB-like AlkP superfamily enzyme